MKAIFLAGMMMTALAAAPAHACGILLNARPVVPGALLEPMLASMTVTEADLLPAVNVSGAVPAVNMFGGEPSPRHSPCGHSFYRAPGGTQVALVRGATASKSSIAEPGLLQEPLPPQWMRGFRLPREYQIMDDWRRLPDDW